MHRPLEVLVVNAGSSSIKLRLLDGADGVVATSDLAADRRGFDTDALREFLRAGSPDVVAHRVVHGGGRFAAPALLDAEVFAEVQRLTDLAPLHQAAALTGIEAVHEVLPDVPSVACFDTTFHSTLTEAARTYALPRKWLRQWPIRRYGFHGLSHAYASRRAGELVGSDGPSARIVVCHLGAGASVCAVREGRSVDTTMGFTPLEGLVMATRSGSVDPGLVLWLQRQRGLTAQEVEEALEHESGLLGLGGSKDIRDLHEAIRTGGPGADDARLAIDVYVHRLVGHVAAMVAALGGLDILVFTAGVGERDAIVRARVGERLSHLGVVIDGPRNDSADGDTDITAASAIARTFVIRAREDLQMSAEARAVLGAVVDS